MLLLVVDGLSMPVFAELSADTAKLGWTMLTRESASWIGAAIAVLPTVTEVSRASLLAGRLTSGTQHAEKTNFSEHPILVSHSRPSTPSLFHKGELEEGLGLSGRVREAVGGQAPRIVGVVYNAIDDQLDGATQVHVRWTLDDLRCCRRCCTRPAAPGACRSDCRPRPRARAGQAQRSGNGGDRWRRPDGELNDGEIRLRAAEC